jgi:two-component system sensor histidine kinase KdpD
MNRSWTGYAWSAGAVLLCTAIGWVMTPRFDPVNIAMVYLLAVVVIALRFSRGAAIATAASSVLLFDVLFVPPVGMLTVNDAQYLLTFAILLAVALIISGLKLRIQREADASSALALTAETERIRSTLLASISHDLRTPLAVMAGASSSLAEVGERMSADERQALARSVFVQAQELSEQVAKLLQMTRLESGAIELKRDWGSLTEIAGAVLSRLKGRLEQHRVIVELPSDLPLLFVDATLIEQALGNLLENAARHTPEGTLVRLRAEKQGDEVVVSVEDYGPGIPDGDLERVFAKFQRGANEPAGGGVGLGLSISRAMVRLHGGSSWAEQLPGGGTAFRFTLPLQTPPEVPGDG